jgi:hypothetical protein
LWDSRSYLQNVIAVTDFATQFRLAFAENLMKLISAEHELCFLTPKMSTVQTAYSLAAINKIAKSREFFALVER